MNNDEIAVSLTYTEEEAREVARSILYFTSNVSATREDQDRLTLIRSAIKIALARATIEEPTGLGAVVEDANGRLWVRAEKAKGMQNPWQDTLSDDPASDRIRAVAYAEISVVRVLSEGIS